MADEMQVFENEAFGSIRTVEIDGDPWFIAADICRALDIKNPTAALQRLDPDEKAKFNLGLSGGATNCVSEFGMYSLILASRKPEAKEFRRWITHEVVPEIRRHGAYSTKGTLDAFVQNPELIVEMAQSLLREQEYNRNLKQQLESALPKADYYDSFVSMDGCSSLRVTAIELGIPEREFSAYLLEHKYLYRSRSKRLMPYAEYTKCGYFVIRDYYPPDGELCQYTLFTCRGKEYFRRQLCMAMG